ncbi:MAG TPA: pyruvate kinase [Burkholderiaceae bacterium]|nr:pyruvate kinase [Burkholderiaceae bacterium]
MPRATKIVATLGPASNTPEVLERMIRAGVDVVRLNFSHGKAQDHIDRAAMVREVAQKVGKEVAIMADLQGPKIRVGKFEGDRTTLEVGQPFILDASFDGLGTNERVGLDYKELPRDVKPGDTLLLNDGLLTLVVDAVRGDEVHTTVVAGGVLSNNKGINKAGGGLTAPALTAKDMEDIKTAMSFQCEYLAISFPKSATDMEMARQLANVAGEPWRHKPQLIAKIERTEAIPALEQILKASDSIMVARGDLAIEVGNAAVPALQKRMIRMAREMDKTVITATQMMESMISNPVPTRAEVSDVANAVLDGTDAVMLSAETAAGKYPVDTVRIMASICVEAEQAEEISLDASFANKKFGRIDQSIAMGALFTAHHLGCKAILALTESGSTALWMSRQKIHVPIFGLTSQIRSQRRMALYRNVTPLLMPSFTDRDQALANAEAQLVGLGVLKPGDTYAITCGEPMGYPGGTNMLKVCRVG